MKKAWAFLDLDNFFYNCMKLTRPSTSEHDIIINEQGYIISCSTHAKICHNVEKMTKTIPEGINAIRITWQMREKYRSMYLDVLKLIKGYNRNAYEWKKDSIIFRIRPADVENIEKAVLAKLHLPCTIGVDETRQDARAKCMDLKEKKKRSIG